MDGLTHMHAYQNARLITMTPEPSLSQKYESNVICIRLNEGKQRYKGKLKAYCAWERCNASV